ncbi:MAG: iron-sulfur cluster assembly accessory protein [Candidatus Marinimicrobia bacterium]|jgi:iron-sulfur cluster assembly protein|nr:iron-sulfur cluster assembly accessory protein [Candidatus Neomarinimicrobiota bacterium]MDP7071981.1 iron-sulfur cluster assembly accessory protein [Candidatus Neomarinimicrobiota bacterium]|tara:strand:- start:230 stop:598 length:369 start_codon:yes stop_codon:yes gene_type:complete
MEKTQKQISNEYAAAEISITKNAAKRLISVMKSEAKSGYALRLSVVGGGCSGMSYNMSFDDEQKEYDKVFESNGVTVYCDLKSYLYLKGVEIDFSTDMLNGGFQIKNPNAERTCGCGTSFSA